MKTKLYAAYGSNLNHEQMSRRCPDAVFAGTAILKNHRLVFRGVADIEWCDGENVQIGLWKVTKKCMDALDSYEGFPNLYGREITDFETVNGSIDATIYFMLQDGYRPPALHYFKSILQGYIDCGLDTKYLYESVEQSINEMA
jgi:gamma-glutamylcyclotransferase (GGCT)/AIG2-like uncharacterized protein YtfP